MDAQFWNDRWATRQIGFHQGKPHALLVKHHAVLAERKRVYVPLCGKTKDLPWLRDQGHDVTGSELVASAVDEFFADEQLTPTVLPRGAHRLHVAPRLTVAQGDALALDVDVVGAFDGVFDRAALVALPPAMRGAYVESLVRLAAGGRILLISFAYDQAKIDGPPFSVDEAQVRALFAPHGTVALLDTVDEPLGPKFVAAGVTTLHELVFQIDLAPRR